MGGLGGGRLPVRRRLAGCHTGRPCASVGLMWGLGRSGSGQALDALPNTSDDGLGVLEFLDGRHARQTVPDGEQPRGRPTSGQFGQFLWASEGVEGGGPRSGRACASRLGRESPSGHHAAVCG